MKKRVVSSIALAAAVSAIISGGVYVTANASEQYIGDAKAKAIALENAGITEAQATFIKSHLDYDDGHVIYDVEFYSGDIEFDYEIDAVSGSIVEYDKDIEYYTVPSSVSAGSRTDYIGEEQAKSIALENAELAVEQVTFIKAHLDYNDGRIVYDVEFFSDITEYDYEIDAVSGEIIEYDFEIEYRAAASELKTSNPPPAGTSVYIGEDMARSIALENAGITEADINKMDVDLDREHGIMIYEIEFISGQKEYEYEINAEDGTLLKSNVEFDD